MMSQNREAKKDRLRSSNDYKTDLKIQVKSTTTSKKIEIITIKNIFKYLFIISP